jgi:phosphatidylglycerol:prolipoprotein diacylglycerol transferase
MLPIVYQNNDFVLYSYPLFMGLGWGIAYQIFFSLTQLKQIKAQTFFWGVFLFAWIGAKAFFVLTSQENTDLFLASNFWFGGGFVFYGGLLAGGIFTVFFKFFSTNFSYEDLWPVLPALTFGHAIGRVGCFLAGCCYGAPTSSSIGIHLHGELRYPTQLIEACGLFLLGLFMIFSNQSRRTLVAHYLIGYGGLRFMIESLRGDVIRGAWGFFTPSQWISLALILTGLAIVLSFKNSHLS